MSSAVFALIVNCMIGVLFATTFAAMAFSHRPFRRVHWFSAAYLMGALTPASELLVRFSAIPKLFVATSFATFILAFYISAVAITKFYRQTTPWPLLIGLLILSLSTRLAIWDGPRNNLIYEFLYQLPFAVASLTCAMFVLREQRRGSLETALAVGFLICGAHFLVKPVFAWYFGSGSTATAYAGSAYALFSQSGTGILMITIGLMLVLVVNRAMLSEAADVSEEDALSGLLNRRGFNRRAAAAVARKVTGWQEIALLILDLDHFKKFNDLYGHDVGDGVIEAFSEILRICAPPSAIVARLGGEEFAILLGDTSEDAALALGNKIRGHLVHLRLDPCPDHAITVSAGLAMSRGFASLADLMKKADNALYSAKREGRDRVCVENPAPKPIPGVNVMSVS
jgi:diguanylate cyclase (GGDEF)-like protein